MTLRTFNPAHIGSDTHTVAHHSEAGSLTSPLIHAVSSERKDWRDAGGPIPPLSDHKLTITDQEKDKATLVDKKSTEEDKAKAAAELYESGIKEFKYKDEAGVERTFKLEQEIKDHKKSIKLSDGSGFESSFEYVQDEHGNWHVVLKQNGGGGPQSEAGRQSAGGARDAGPRSGGGGGGGGGGRRSPEGIHPSSDGSGVGRYQAPSGGHTFRPDPSNPDSQHAYQDVKGTWKGVTNGDGSVAISFKGCQVDTDGAGAGNHPEDRTRQYQTSLRLSNGQSLNSDTDNFFVLPPEVAKAYGIKKGDLGWLVDKDTQKAVPVVFGDSGPSGKLGEASVHALKSLGFENVNGANGVDKNHNFQVVFVPGSGNGKGDIARDPKAMAARLDGLGRTGATTQIA
ncbi:hypothetical protein BH10CYA1_BH10CYA1_28970 [soil metagenome]